MRKLFAAALIAITLLFSGCTIPFITDGKTYKLDSRWAPLETVEEATDKLFAPGMTTTIGKHCYVPDLAQWKKDYPDGSNNQEALLLHEQLHAIRQLSWPGGISTWIAKYVAESSFRWQEEQMGYELQIRYLLSHGYFIDVQEYAQIMSQDYKVLGIPMVSYNDALAWLNNLMLKIATGN